MSARVKRHADRERLIRALRAAELAAPELRIGQLIVCALPDHMEGDPFYIEDAELAAAIERCVGVQS